MKDLSLPDRKAKMGWPTGRKPVGTTSDPTNLITFFQRLAVGYFSQQFFVCEKFRDEALL
jgi:hypothetical protein